jgi:phosphatidylserine/phosphatidylglycerophosphate/cardiolipin synthase-like enzyme
VRRNRLLVSLALLVAVTVVVAAVLVVRSRGRGMPEGEPPAAAIEVFFTTPQPQGRPAASGSPGRLDERLTSLIDGARRTVDVAIYDLELDNVTDALVRAHRRGVRVRLVTDSDNAALPAVERLRAADVPVVEDGRGAIMHHKFVVLDGERVWTGSWNFTPNDTFRYNNHGVLIHSRALAENYAAEFAKMFEGRRFGPTKDRTVPHPRVQVDGATVETIFESEGDAPTRIVERIRGAREGIAFLAFTFTDDRIGAAMEERFRAGVPVRGVFDATQADRPESELGRFRRAGMDGAQPGGVPAGSCAAGPGVLADANPSLMHHKVIIIDGRTVIFGSYNFTRNAAEDNDENLLIVDDPAVARLFLAEFCRVYNAAVERARTR